MAAEKTVRSKVLRYVKPIHRKLRGQKTDLFLRMVGNGSEPGRLLDVGGGLGIDGEFLQLYGRFREVVVVNLDAECMEMPPDVGIKRMVADGRDLPFETNSFDWVFSNAVIEHVGGWRDQVLFAKEMRRVASRGYFVATPNKFFPVEPHTLLPFYQFLPVPLQRKIAPYCPGYLRKYEEIRLLSAGEMQELFPEATVKSMGFPVLGNNLAAFYRRGAEV
jgi:ubiquinone/menaquinone biosynthesis C-methylase UbiE